MSNDDIAGDEPLADGMHVAVRLRRDYTVTDAARLLAAARAAYARANPGAGPQDDGVIPRHRVRTVTCPVGKTAHVLHGYALNPKRRRAGATPRTGEEALADGELPRPRQCWPLAC